MNTTDTKRCDVLIIGSGTAGACLARQLRLEQPQLSVIVVDKRERFEHWVGESLTEEPIEYMTRVLGLGPYLAKHQLAKNGLRFFFDAEHGGAPLTSCSETADSDSLTKFPGYQIDRASFDAFLCASNRALGAEQLQGVKVGDIELDAEHGHRVQTSAGEIRCKWLVDASGRRALLARKLGLSLPEDRLPTSAYWGVFRNVADIDAHAPDDARWHARIKMSSRHSATCHYMYRGYWMWQIPIDHDLTSIGLVYRRDMTEISIKSGDELLAFLRRHRALGELLEHAELDAFHGLKQLPRRVSQVFSDQRWFITGEAGVFVDPLYSLNGNFIAESNMFIADLIGLDHAGETARHAKRLAHYNAAVLTNYEVFMEHYFKDIAYQAMGSFEAFRIASFTLANFYYNHPVWDMSMRLTELEHAIDGHHDCHCADLNIPAIERPRFGPFVHTVTKLMREFWQYLWASGHYYDKNLDHFALSGCVQERFVTRLRTPPDEQDRASFDRWLHRNLFWTCLSRMAELEEVAIDEAAFARVFEPAFGSGQTLAGALAQLRAQG